MLPIAAVGIVSTMTASRTYGRYGARTTLLIGTAALAVGGLLVTFVESSSTPLVVLLVVAAILGIPNGSNNMGNQNLVNSVTTSATSGRLSAFTGLSSASEPTSRPSSSN